MTAIGPLPRCRPPPGTAALLGVNLPAASPFVNPDSAHRGPRREAGGASIIPPDATAPLDAPCRRARTDDGGAIGSEAPRGPRRAMPLCQDQGEALGREASGPAWPGGQRLQDQARDLGRDPVQGRAALQAIPNRESQFPTRSLTSGAYSPNTYSTVAWC
jgi:hypothetical protein